MKDIERALNASDLGITPANDGTVIRIVIPQLTGERRQEIAKQVGKLAEKGKIAVRNVRRDAMDTLKRQEKNGDITEDEQRSLEKQVQKVTDDATKETMSESKKSLNHLAIIMDGNGRWAKKRNLLRFVGHRHGMDNIRNIALAANEMGIKVLTLYAFSTENWARPTDEVNYLMRLPIDFFDKFMPELMENNVRVNIMGFLDELPEKTYLVTQKAMAETANNTGMVLNFAFNYGSRREITAGVQEIARQVKAGKINPSDIDEKMVSDHLLTHSLTPYDDPDLLIRTSGEERLSNFLLWQMAYTEFSFSNKLWPDFDKNDLENLVKDYYGRNRRFGKL